MNIDDELDESYYNKGFTGAIQNHGIVHGFKSFIISNKYKIAIQRINP